MTNSYLRIIAFWLFAILAFVWLLARCDEPADPVTAQEQTANLDESTARYACMEFLKRQMNDPDSAKFERRSEWPAVTNKDGTITVLVSGRAKNGFGAYILGQWLCAVRLVGREIRLDSIAQISP